MEARDQKGKFRKGHPGFKKPGSISKLNSELRQKIGDFLDGNWERIKIDFQELKPKERIEIYDKLLSHVLPRLQSIEVKSEFDVDAFLQADSDTRLEMLNQYFSENE